MFRCEECGRATKANEKQFERTVSVRPMVYYKKDKKKNIVYNDRGEPLVAGEGYATVKVVNICKQCDEKWDNPIKVLELH